MENKEQTARKDLENIRTRSKLLEIDYRLSKKTRKIENKEQTIRKQRRNFRTRGKPLARDLRISKDTRGGKVRSKPRSKRTGDLQNTEQSARKSL